MSDSNKEKKSRSAYNWFLAEGDWDEHEISQRKADMFFEAVHLQEGDRVLLIIDDTYNKKKGKRTEGNLYALEYGLIETDISSQNRPISGDQSI